VVQPDFSHRWCRFIKYIFLLVNGFKEYTT
jgi:hypothetical protein